MTKGQGFEPPLDFGPKLVSRWPRQKLILQAMRKIQQIEVIKMYI